ncbi:MAG TPA: 2-oxo acid dehydrogenase subunit E2 [Longimicrobium sp.]|nr:2-oxo acid dehydrogenase subunit E2 [Longimicrobium sp.]
MIASLARAVGEDRRVQAYRLGRRRLVVFDDVDVCVLVEHAAADGPPVASPHVIRAADRRSYVEIHQELRALQAGRATREMEAGGWIPGVLWRGFWRLLERRPRLHRRVAGTVGVTAVGMFGRGAGFGIPISDYTLMLTVGGIAERPAFAAGGSIERREYLSLTVSVDHDVVDGAPAARFIQRLKELLESGHGLDAAALAAEPEHRGRQTALAVPA